MNNKTCIVKIMIHFMNRYAFADESYIIHLFVIIKGIRIHECHHMRCQTTIFDGMLG